MLNVFHDFLSDSPSPHQIRLIVDGEEVAFRSIKDGQTKMSSAVALAGCADPRTLVGC